MVINVERVRLGAAKWHWSFCFLDFQMYGPFHTDETANAVLLQGGKTGTLFTYVKEHTKVRAIAVMSVFWTHTVPSQGSLISS